MEELYIFALLLNEEIIPEESYFKRLDELFLGNPKNEIRKRKRCIEGKIL